METIGIIGAMDKEIAVLCEHLASERTEVFGGLTFRLGTVFGKPVVIVKSGVGKVNAALCAQTLIVRFGVGKIINTGIAGATESGLRVFDFVVSTAAVYHDVDVQIFGYKPGQIPQLPESFPADRGLIYTVAQAFEKSGLSATHKLVRGLVASGDQFISSAEKKAFIKSTFSPACVEMEGAAIAHACSIFRVPFVIVRCMSDMADDTAEKTYDFNEDAAATTSSSLIFEFLKNI